MNANAKFGLILGIILLILIIGGGLLGFAYFQQETAKKYLGFIFTDTTTIENGKTTETTTVSGVTSTTTTSGETEVATEEIASTTTTSGGDVQSFARSFTERFGSFSNQNDFENILDVKIYMTKDMKKWADEYVEKEKKDKPKEVTYYGITTKVINVDLVNIDEKKGQADMKITTQRKETKGDPSVTETEEQEAQAVFVEEDGTWKVDKFIWL
ncbi:MAG: hypothetical protein ABH835_01085 [Patescibacteria group bacterium]